MIEVEYIDYCCTKPGWYWWFTNILPVQTYGPYETEDEATTAAMGGKDDKSKDA